MDLNEFVINPLECAALSLSADIRKQPKNHIEVHNEGPLEGAKYVNL